MYKPLTLHTRTRSHINLGGGGGEAVSAEWAWQGQELSLCTRESCSFLRHYLFAIHGKRKGQQRYFAYTYFPSAVLLDQGDLSIHVLQGVPQGQVGRGGGDLTDMHTHMK